MGSGAFPTEHRAAHARGAEAASRGSRRRGDLATCLLLGILAFLTYNANLRSISAADTLAARYLPFSIWRHQTLVLDPIVTGVAQGRKLPATRGQVETAFWITRGRGDHFISLYPVAVPVVIAPLYWPAVRYLEANGWDAFLLDNVARIMEKLCASLLATVTVMLVYLLLRRRTDRATAALLTLVFAFGTTTWVISSQALWMHGSASLRSRPRCSSSPDRATGGGPSRPASFARSLHAIASPTRYWPRASHSMDYGGRDAGFRCSWQRARCRSAWCLPIT
jgi:hypothetical protein